LSAWCELISLRVPVAKSTEIVEHRNQAAAAGATVLFTARNSHGQLSQTAHRCKLSEALAFRVTAKVVFRRFQCNETAMPLRIVRLSDRSAEMSVPRTNAPAQEKIARLETVAGEQILLSRYAGFHLDYVIECGSDLIAQVCIADAQIPSNNRKARVYVSRHPGVALLVDLARVAN
jgi:hypothetical protein